MQYRHLRWFYVAKLDIHVVQIVVNHRQGYVVRISVSGENSSFLVPEMCTTCDHTLVSDSSASDVSSEHSCTPDGSILGLYLLQSNHLPLLAFALLKGVQGRGWGMPHLSNLLAVFCSDCSSTCHTPSVVQLLYQWSEYCHVVVTLHVQHLYGCPTEVVCLESMCKAPVFDSGEQANFDGLLIGLVLCLLLSCNCCTY